MEQNYVLYHSGIKGMRWGIRRFQNKDGSLTPAGKKRRREWSDDAKTASEIKKKHVKEMSNAELRKLNERMQLEQTYNSLTKQHRSAGAKIAGEILGGAGKDLVKSYIVKYSKMGIDKAIGAAITKAKSK